MKNKANISSAPKPKPSQVRQTTDLKKVLTGLFVLNVVALYVLYSSVTGSNTEQPQLTEPEPFNAFEVKKVSSDKFDHPLLAYHVLNALDEFEPVTNKYYNHIPKASNWSVYPYMGLTLNEEYCQQHRALFVSNTSAILEMKNFMTDLWPKHFVRDSAFGSFLRDTQPNVSTKIAPENKMKRIASIDINQNHFIINNFYHVFQHLGKNYGCLTQTYNHIPGDGSLNRKDFVSESITKYAKNYVNRSQCFSYEKAFPRTWVLYIKEQCQDFFRHFHSEEHARLKAISNIVYIRKIGAGAHNGNGVFSMDEEEEKNITVWYEDGKKCGEIKENNIIQYFIPNPLLLYGHKFDFRVYMLVASVNPLIAYYHDGYLKVSLHKYERNVNNKYALLTNTNVSKEVWKEAVNGKLINGMNETELQYFQRWDFPKFEAYLLQEGVVKDPKWIENYLRPEFKKAMIHLLRMSKYGFLKRSQIYELFGVDFMLDEDLNLWFIEANTSPSLSPTYPETIDLIKNNVKDLMEIVIGLTKSRVKRIIEYVNTVTSQEKIGMDAQGRAILEDLQAKKLEFKRVIENRFERGYEPRPENEYQPIVDENIPESPERYMGLLPQECL